MVLFGGIHINPEITDCQSQPTSCQPLRAAISERADVDGYKSYS